MPTTNQTEHVRPHDVILKLLMSKREAPFGADEKEILRGYLMRLPLAKLGAFAKKEISEMADEDFGEIIRAKIQGVLESKEKKSKA